MTPKAAMVLTGKRALDYSGSVSAEDNFGIGGYERIMGLNGQAQYWARDIAAATQVLLSRTTLPPTWRRASASRGAPAPRSTEDVCGAPARCGGQRLPHGR